jgi:hypothetical protein
MSRPQLSRPLTNRLKQSSRLQLADTNDPFKDLLSHKLRLKPACPSHKHASTLRTELSECPALPILRPFLSSRSKPLHKLSLFERRPAKRLSMESPCRPVTPYFSGQSDELTSSSTAPSSSENSPVKEKKRPKMLDTMHELR